MSRSWVRCVLTCQSPRFSLSLVRLTFVRVADLQARVNSLLRSISVMPDVMLAARFHSASAPLKIEDCPLPALQPGEVLVRVLASGVCGSDLPMWRGSVPVRKRPITLGAEVAGAVAARGP